MAWFDYPVRAQPHHTDYGGIVWHGTYVTWMESARVDCLRSVGLEFAQLVDLGCDLPVVDMTLRYHRPVRLGMEAIVKTGLIRSRGIRMNWAYRIQSPDAQTLYVTGNVALVPVDPGQGKIMRRLPPELKTAIAQLPLVEATEFEPLPWRRSS